MINLSTTKTTFLCAEIRLLKLFDDFSKESLALSFDFNDYADSVGISYSTLKNYLKTFRDAGLLKFSYKQQKIVLNPDVFVIAQNLPESVLIFARGGFANFASD